jgi:hypothetical protein
MENSQIEIKQRILGLIISIVITRSFKMNEINTIMGNETIIQYSIITIIGFIQFSLLDHGLKNNTKQNAEYLTSLGIFGTFLGIAVGLLFFDPEDIDGSVTALLGGMKIAFISSVMGLFGYLWLNYKIEDIGDNQDTGLGDLLYEMNQGNQVIADKLDTINSSVTKLDSSITGENDGSLLSQILLLRTNLNDKFGDLINQFQKFAKLQAENNTKALVTAIQEVIGDFNAKINEQFGENFKELNAAVGDLVTWQDNYKDILDKSIEQFEISVKSIDRSKSMLEVIEERYETNMKVNEDIKVVLESIQSETNDLENKMENFSGLAKSAKDAFPVIEENLNSLTSGFSNKVNESIESVTSYIKDQNDEAVKVMTNIEDATKDTINSLNKNTESAMKMMAESVETSSNSITSASEKMRESVGRSIDEVTDKIEIGFKESLTNVNQLQQQIATNMENNIVQMDDALRQELEKSLQSLGSQLASLSQKFVDDYGDLTNKMRTVVTMAEG